LDSLSSHAKTRRREGVFLFQGIPKYDHPHLNMTKVLLGITRENIETIVRPVYVSAAVTVGEFEGEKQAPGWQPPDWGFDSGCEECNELAS
jgi:hypothetical protein